MEGHLEYGPVRVTERFLPLQIHQIPELFSNEGEVIVNEAKEQHSKLVGGIVDPAWSRSPAGVNKAPADSSYASQLPGRSVSGRGSEPAAGRAGSGASGTVSLEEPLASHLQQLA